MLLASSTAVLMEGFHWDSAKYKNPDWYTIMASNAADIKAWGVMHIWFPPPSDFLSTQGYLPRQLSVFSSSYGSQTELQTAISAFKRAGH